MTIGKKYSWILLGTTLGMIGGYLYWQEIGCISGSCPITSSPIYSTLYGALMGGLAVNIFQKEKPNT